MSTGCLVLVVGPSGAGKDTVLNYARVHLAGDPAFVFSRRVITRPKDASEDHEPVTEDEFIRRRFALSWYAHGLHYGIPAEVEHDIAAGRTVIANVSRAVIAGARQIYRCLVVEITAPPGVLAARLAARQREPEADIAARLARIAPYDGADITILNDASPEAAGNAFLAALRQG